MRRALLVGIVGALVVSTGGACGRAEQTGLQQVRAAMTATGRLSRGIVYRDTAADVVVEVRARVDDDLRYKATLTIGGVRAFDEVVVDDALADRVIDPSAYRALGVSTVPGALAAGQWVVDAFGAPSTLPSDLASLRSGDDPVLSAVTVFRQLDRIMGDARSVHRFDPESLSYRPKEDPFPHPDRDAGELRYDADRPPLPRPGAGGAASRVLPGPQHFRKLAIYVRRGRVVRILERVDISDRLRDLERIYNLGVTASDAASVRATQALAVINRLRKVTGGEAIRQHTLDVRFTDLGRPVSIELPADAVPGNLAALPHRGDHEAKRG